MDEQITQTVKHIVEWCVLIVEIFAVAVIFAGVAVVVVRRGTIRYLFQTDQDKTYENYKQQLGRPLLLGLELLVAADVIRTVALAPTLTNVAVLGLLVFVRTLLSWSLTVEMEGRWPWQPKRVESGETGDRRRETERTTPSSEADATPPS